MWETLGHIATVIVLVVTGIVVVGAIGVGLFILILSKLFPDQK